MKGKHTGIKGNEFAFKEDKKNNEKSLRVQTIGISLWIMLQFFTRWTLGMASPEWHGEARVVDKVDNELSRVSINPYIRHPSLNWTGLPRIELGLNINNLQLN